MLKLQQLREQKEKNAQQQQQANVNGTETIKNDDKKENNDDKKKTKQENFFKIAGSSDTKKSHQKACDLRVQKDLSELDPNSTPGVAITFPDPSNLLVFKVEVIPTEGLYKGAKFNFTVTVSSDYPFSAPQVVCDTLVYHPNIDLKGRVCLNILRADWKPVLTLGSVLFGLMTLFLEPNPDDPLNQEAADQMVQNKAEFERNVKKSLRGGIVAGHQFPKLLN